MMGFALALASAVFVISDIEFPRSGLMRVQPAFVGMCDLSTSELVERLRLGRRLAGDGWLAQRPCTWPHEGC